jgi:hypothetical protein
VEQFRQAVPGQRQRLAVVADDEGAERAAEDHQEFVGLEQRGQVAVLQDEAAEHGQHDDEETCDDQHGAAQGVFSKAQL